MDRLRRLAVGSIVGRVDAKPVNPMFLQAFVDELFPDGFTHFGERSFLAIDQVASFDRREH